MGGVRIVGIGVDCDRCGKTVPVTDEGHGEFYKDFSKREERDDRMFVAIAKMPGGEAVSVDFEYVCPKCADAIVGYLKKIDKNLEEKKEETPKEEKPKEAKTKEAKTKKKPKPEPEPEPEQYEEPPDFDDDALFDE